MLRWYAIRAECVKQGLLFGLCKLIGKCLFYIQFNAHNIEMMYGLNILFNFDVQSSTNW